MINEAAGKPIVKIIPVDQEALSFKELAVKAKLARDRIKTTAGTIDVRLLPPGLGLE
jgi:hypothetical protein